VIKENPWPYVNLVRLAQDSGIDDAKAMKSSRSQAGVFPELDWNMIDSKLI
jgi:hypothetical protein